MLLGCVVNLINAINCVLRHLNNSAESAVNMYCQCLHRAALFLAAQKQVATNFRRIQVCVRHGSLLYDGRQATAEVSCRSRQLIVWCVRTTSRSQTTKLLEKTGEFILSLYIVPILLRED